MTRKNPDQGFQERDKRKRPSLYSFPSKSSYGEVSMWQQFTEENCSKIVCVGLTDRVTSLWTCPSRWEWLSKSTRLSSLTFLEVVFWTFNLNRGEPRPLSQVFTGYPILCTRSGLDTKQYVNNLTNYNKCMGNKDFNKVLRNILSILWFTLKFLTPKS